MEKRVFYNPKIKDKVTVLKTAADTCGNYILVEVELAAGGGVPLHYHTTFAETFIAVEGVVGLVIGRQKMEIQPPHSATAPIGEVHRFFNPGKSPVRFRVKISPAENRFLESLCIGYGLAEDGKTNDKGTPKKFDHLAVLLEHSDTRFTGFIGLIQPLLLRRAKSARKRGVMKELMEHYCQ
ncbi:MAG TPA: cupin domain-containing protein [Flavisolibacter sp.]|nr:cupin domain-containing protein [Flavisolibacter sp.]